MLSLFLPSCSFFSFGFGLPRAFPKRLTGFVNDSTHRYFHPKSTPNHTAVGGHPSGPRRGGILFEEPSWGVKPFHTFNDCPGNNTLFVTGRAAVIFLRLPNGVSNASIARRLSSSVRVPARFDFYLHCGSCTTLGRLSRLRSSST